MLEGVRVAPDLMERDFNPLAANRTWSADITYIRTWEGWLYLAHVQDLFSRRIVGWAMADHLRAELVVDALQMALAQRKPDPAAGKPAPVLSNGIGANYADVSALLWSEKPAQLRIAARVSA
jgi:transposase InsO family protein